MKAEKQVVESYLIPASGFLGIVKASKMNSESPKNGYQIPVQGAKVGQRVLFYFYKNEICIAETNKSVMTVLHYKKNRKYCVKVPFEQRFENPIMVSASTEDVMKVTKGIKTSDKISIKYEKETLYINKKQVSTLKGCPNLIDLMPKKFNNRLPTAFNIDDIEHGMVVARNMTDKDKTTTFQMWSYGEHDFGLFQFYEINSTDEKRKLPITLLVMPQKYSCSYSNVEPAWWWKEKGYEGNKLHETDVIYECLDNLEIDEDFEVDEISESEVVSTVESESPSEETPQANEVEAVQVNENIVENENTIDIIIDSEEQQVETVVDETPTLTVVEPPVSDTQTTESITQEEINALMETPVVISQQQEAV